MFDHLGRTTDSGREGEEEKPFIINTSSQENDDEEDPPLLQRRYRKIINPFSKSKRSSIIPISVHIILVLLYSIISIVLIVQWSSSSSSSSNKQCPELPLPALSDLSIKYGVETFPKMRDSPYVGRPSERLEKAWHDLVADMSIRVSGSELERYGGGQSSSVALPKGGYFAWLGVFHQLHCVKMLRQLNYREHYHPNMTTKQTADWQVHADHCLELLRASSMCHADTTSLTTFMWHDHHDHHDDSGGGRGGRGGRGSEKPMLSNQRSPHQCVDWDALVASTRHRAVSVDELEAMTNPYSHPARS